MPDAVAVSEDGKRLFAANTGSDAIAVFALGGRQPQTKPVAWLPTEWYPTALAVQGNKLYVATAKGQGTGPNNMPQP
jgi:DNA-binding beta-propeller fold protein YncE